MGAHSGTSSDDIVLMLAYYDNNSGIFKYWIRKTWYQINDFSTSGL